MIENKPFRMTVEQYDEKITIEINHSDLSFSDYVEICRKMGNALAFSSTTVDDYFSEDR